MKKKNKGANYTKYVEDMTLNDHLAVERTILANERTLLAYLRTVIAFIVAGITLRGILVGEERILVMSILFISSFIFCIYGIYNYVKLSKKLKFDKDI